MAKQVNIKGYWPEVVSKIKDFEAIAETEDVEFTDAWAELETVWNDQYIADATERGVKRWEDNLGIVPKGTETLDDRKFRLLNRFNEQLPYTDRSLRQRLDTLCGPNGYVLTIDVLNCILVARIELTVKNQFDVVAQLLEDIVPLNMFIDLDLRYNQHSTLAQFTHGHLSAYTHDQLRNEVIS